eukprot:CAMPEP_0172610926 /NCGR_PEP_ID=MMETSP1068-20121228/30671_1 /TAXON_ID=35684 /ORGANISM="Pseudopedinella elastica, Strain CCMP716" /LENGTH=78 /DNA_ID=CAMNT_0013414759 /DNA_START=420 /DNA_END=652 /DNA_ORIENTATION=+
MARCCVCNGRKSRGIAITQLLALVSSFAAPGACAHLREVSEVPLDLPQLAPVGGHVPTHGAFEGRTLRGVYSTPPPPA